MKLFIGLLFCLLGVDALGTTKPPYHYHIPTGNGYYGIDISHYNPVLNWTQVITNDHFPLRFIFTKATEGSDYVDPVFYDYWSNMTSFPDIVSGLYHFYRSDDTVEENFKNIKENIFDKIEFNRTRNLMAIDFESNYSHRNKSEMAYDLNAFLERFVKEFHFRPFIYCGANFWKQNVGVEGEQYLFSDYPLWTAHYGPTTPLFASAWQNYTIWQFTSIEHIPGIKGHVDTDWWPNPPMDLFGDSF